MENERKCFICDDEIWIDCEICENLLCCEHQNSYEHLPLVNDIKKKQKKDDVIKFLQRRDLNLDLDNEAIEIIKSKKISGRALLCLTDEKLESYGPVVTIAELVKESK